MAAKNLRTTLTKDFHKQNISTYNLLFYIMFPPKFSFLTQELRYCKIKKENVFIENKR